MRISLILIRELHNMNANLRGYNLLPSEAQEVMKALKELEQTLKVATRERGEAGQEVEVEEEISEKE